MARVRQTGAFRRIAAVQLEDVRAHRAIKGIPYVPRDCEPDVEHAMQQRRLLIVGSAMAGKTRLALQLARDIFPDHGFVDARDGTDLRAMLQEAPDESSLVVWLDDLVRFLGADAVNRHVLDLLYTRGNVLVATIGSNAYDNLMSDSVVRPAGWGVPAWFGVPVRLGDWSEREFDRAARRGVSEPTLVTARRFGLSACVGGGPVLLRRLRAGSTTQPVGCAVVRAAVDWRRTGTSASLSRAVLVDLLPAYLGASGTSPAAAEPDALPNGISWATTRVNGVALVDESESGFDVLDYALEQLTVESSPIPEPVWDAVLAHARPHDLVAVGYHAATGHERPDIAMAAYRRAAVSQDPDSASAAALSLGTLTQAAEAAEPTAEAVEPTADTTEMPAVVPDVAAVSTSQGVQDAPAVAYETVGDSGEAAAATTQAMIAVAPPPGDTEPKRKAVTSFELGEPTGPSEGRQASTGGSPPIGSALDLGIRREGEGDLEDAADAYQQAIESGDPDQGPAAAVRLGVLRNEKSRDLVAAAEAFQVAIDSTHPDHAPDAHVQLGTLLREIGNAAGAAAAYQRAIETGHAAFAGEASRRVASLRDDDSVKTAAPMRGRTIDTRIPPADPKQAFELGMDRLKHRDLDGAMAAWQRALESEHPEHAPAAALCMASVHSHRGDSASAVEAFQFVIDSGHPDHAPEAALGLGDLRQARGDIGLATSAYQIAIDSGHATHAATAAAKSTALHEEHDRLQRAATYQQTIETGDPDQAPRAALLLAVLCQSQGDSEGEAAAYQVAIDYGHPEALPVAAYNLGVLRQEAGELDLAAAAWQLAIDSGDATYGPMAAFNLGILRREGDDVDAAIAAWRVAVSSGDAEYGPAAALELGDLLRDVGDLSGAAALWEFVLASGHPDYAPWAAFDLGVLRQDQDDVDGAVAAWQYAVDSRHPDSTPAAALRLGHLRRAQGDLHRAVASYQLAIDSGHEHGAPEAAICLGLLLEEHGDLGGAAVAYQVAIDSHHETEAPEAAVRLGLLLERRGDQEGATAAYQVAVDSPDPVNSQDAEAYLKNLGEGVNNNADESVVVDAAPELTTNSQDDRDADLPGLTSLQGRRLRLLVRDAFLVRGVDVTMLRGSAALADGTVYGLHDLAVRCENASRSEDQWPSIVGDYVDTILGITVPKADPLDSLSVENVFSRTFLRVYDRASLRDNDGYSYARPVVGELVELLVLDLPDSVQILHRMELERFDRNALHSAALAHLLAEPIDDYAVFTDNGGTIHVAYGRSVYIASKLLILPDVLARTVGKREPPHGVLVAVPNLHEIAFHPIVDRSAVPSLQQLSDFAANAFTEEEGSVSPFVYWWQQGRLTQLTRFDAGGRIVPGVDDAFQHVLNGLIGSV